MERSYRCGMNAGKNPTTLRWMIEPLNDGPVVPVVLERAVPADLYFEIVGATDDFEAELVITI